MRTLGRRAPLPERVEIIIIGGGINGVALARECALAHKSVLLLERDDFASGTSSHSSRIVSGGLNFLLERASPGGLRESLHGRASLLLEQPHLVHPLDFIFADGAGSRYSGLELRAALWLYRKLGKFSSGASGEQTESLRSSLDPVRSWTLYPFQDAMCEFPERLVADWLREACTAGAIARNHASALAIRTSEGHVRGVLLRDGITGEDSYVESEWVINASGPWIDSVRDLTGLATPRPLARGIRSSYLMLRRWNGSPTIGLQAKMGKAHAISVTPWNGMLQVGSTEVSQGTDPSQASPSAEEVECLLTSAATLFPGARLTADSIAFTYAGVYPIPNQQSKGLTSVGFASLSGRSFMHNHADEGALGLLSIFGGTLATASSLAQKTAHTMGLHLDRMPAPQLGVDVSSDVESTLQQWASSVHTSTGIPQSSTDAIARWHGRHAMCVVHSASRDPVLRMPIVDGHPQLVAQAAEAVAYEHAVTLADILLRRVPIALYQDWDEDSTMQAAARIAPSLNWSERRMKEEVEAFEEEHSRFLHRPKNLKPTGIAA